jgi:flavodoxin
MTALVLVESSFGNTRTIAEAIREGLAAHTDTELLDIAHAPELLSATVDLLVVGGPTHAFGMSRPETREDAIRQGAPPTDTRVGLREWIAALLPDGPRPPVVAFDTRTKHRWIPGSAASQAAAALAQRGFPSAGPRQSFRVDDVPGPLMTGEVERARAWGEQLGSRLAVHRKLHPR